MSQTYSLEPIQIGLVSDQPIRLEGLVSIFELPATEGNAPLVPITGTLQEMLNRPELGYLVVDMHASPADWPSWIPFAARVPPCGLS